MKTYHKVQIVIEMQVEIETEYTENDILEMFDATVSEIISETFTHSHDPEYQPQLTVNLLNHLQVASTIESIPKPE